MKGFKVNKKRYSISVLASLIILSLVVVAFATVRYDEEIPVAEIVPLSVEFALPVYKKITMWDEYTGRFEASSRAEVRARVSGFLEEVNFNAGEYVKKGEVLFVIDQRPFIIELNQVKASYTQALASLKTAQDNYTRIESLRETGALSTEEYDRRKQDLVHAEASIQFAQAKIDNAKLNLEFTKVRAPISGLVSRDRVNAGNLVDGGSANSTLLTTIVSTSPIHFYFTGSESEHLKYVRLALDGKRGSIRSQGFPIKIKLADEKFFSHNAKMDFVDNEIDRQSGTIESRAILQNADRLLEPGMFGKARLISSDEHEAIMIPDEIIGTNQSFRYVYVLDKKNVVISKIVTLGPLHTNGLRIIKDGLSSSDKVITNNIQKISPGITVSPKEIQIKENSEEETKATARTE